MRKRTRNRALALTAVTLLLMPLAVSAGPQGPPGRFLRGPGAEHGRHGDFMMGRLVRRLDLSEDQRESIQALLEVQRETTAPLREELGVKREAVFEASHGEPLDEAAIRAAVLDAATLEAELAVARARLRAEVWQLLTPDQQAKAEAMRETFRELHREIRDEVGRGRGGYGAGPRWRGRR